MSIQYIVDNQVKLKNGLLVDIIGFEYTSDNGIKSQEPSEETNVYSAKLNQRIGTAIHNDLVTITGVYAIDRYDKVYIITSDNDVQRNNSKRSVATPMGSFGGRRTRTKKSHKKSRRTRRRHH